MPPKKDEKKKPDDPEAKFLEEIRQLERAKNDMAVEQAFMMDKFRQMKAENDRLKDEMSTFRGRLGNATEDYADILEHRQEQIKAEETKLRSMQQQIERMEADINKYLEEIAKLTEQNRINNARLDESASLLRDRDTLEDAVRKQHDLIEKQSEELKALKRQLEERDSSLEKANVQIEELTLKSTASTEMKILFDEPWLVQLSHSRLKGEIPIDREWNTLSALSGGKLLMLCGGTSRTALNDAAGMEVAVLNAETSVWERPNTGRMFSPVNGHSASVVGRTKVMILAGMKGEAITADVSIFNTDTMKWFTPQVKGVERPAPRTLHACTSIREKIFVFGGQAADDTLLNDLWIFDQDSNSWMHVNCYGILPSARHGASICASEDGRRLYLFGGNDGSKALNDVHYLDLEKLHWNAVPVHVGAQPEPREGHAAFVTSKYMVISGGCAQGGTKRLADVQVLDLYSPRWECLDEGQYIGTMPFAKQHAVYTCFYGNKLFTLKPSVHEKLYELQILEVALPEDIERLRHSRKRDLGLSERLELADDAICGINSIELSWKPPTKNAERIEKYKLMIATSTGVVKDVYQGPEQRFRITGLKPNTEYILCVKALYDDGSFLWSESKAYMTKL
ncbi:hypothetical protein CEUSTIGMA_g1676.t1 [Chlamydomonas eustigma]|uniref:Fibronectin type-III domain-containing protein n=1 Tax=Chlamydomonas eustigma TaxID=1157962 RepID=A0A250WTS7_9CHLO|nr:hypothetical protein CEUSTIGMA_g1676.t1 [Chlamydomonas eustigma]|eukprot:GAX74227.1 hypothetical protein CEUSTIGMA_g1676.t1 [Chlamydomonas eustigma]